MTDCIRGYGACERQPFPYEGKVAWLLWLLLELFFLLDEALIKYLSILANMRADNHCVLPEENEKFDVHSLLTYSHYNTMQIDDFKTCTDQRGISIDADVALWLDKLEVDGSRPQLPQF